MSEQGENGSVDAIANKWSATSLKQKLLIYRFHAGLLGSSRKRLLNWVNFAAFERVFSFSGFLDFAHGPRWGLCPSTLVIGSCCAVC